jgi:YD repeat-containing protein
VVISNAAGNVTSNAATLGVTAPLQYTYDSDGRLLQATYSTGQQVAYSYDNAGNLLAVAATSALPTIVSQPLSVTLNSGSTVILTLGASGASTYQWLFNGAALSDGSSGGVTISGSTGPQLMISGVNAAKAGNYTCVITNDYGQATSSAADLQVAVSSNPGLASSISTRAFVGTGDNILIGGFYIVGSTSRTVLVQALGPALTPLGVSGALQHPELSIHQLQNGHDVTLYSNIGWSANTGAAEQQVLFAAAAAVFASPVLVAGSADSELLLTLPPGGYSAEVGGADGGTGVALCAIYELP